jgi:hypothetical protein
MATTDFVNGTVVQADWLNDVDEVVYGLPTSGGAGLVGTSKAGAGAVVRSVADVQDRRTSPSDYGTIAQMMTAERATRRVIELDRTLHALPATLAIDVVTPNSENGLIFRGSGWSLASNTSSSGFSGYGLTSPLIQIAATEPTDAPFVFEDLGIFGSESAPVSSGQDGISGRVNNLTLNRALIKHMGRHGVNITESWSSVFNGGMIFGCFGNGLHLLDAANRMSIRDVQAFGNGRSYTNPNQANMFLFSPSNISYGAVIDNVDVSYSGFVEYGAAQISSLTVSSGIATMVFTAAHGRSNGDSIAVKRTGNLALDGDFAYTVTVVNPTTITFPTSAANGTYSSTATSVGPFSSGLFMVGHHGVTLRNFYSEDNMGFAAYVGQCRGVTFEGGFVLNSKIFIDSDNKGVQIGGIKFQGTGGLKTVEANQRAEINVLSSNVFEDGATWERGAYFMLDGVRYGAGQPTTGTWQVGERLVRVPQVVGQPKAWVCTVAGTPGTWVSEGNL